MNPTIKKVAILGSGLMGSRIACHFAGIGVQVLLLDMVSPDANPGASKAERNKLVNAALQTAIKSNPSPVYTADVPKRITTGNFEDDLSAMIYTVTDVAENQVVLDGNHPLAGMSLRFWLQVEEVRVATDDEIQNRYPKGAEGLGFGLLDESDEEGDEDYIGGVQKKDGDNPHTLH